LVRVQPETIRRVQHQPVAPTRCHGPKTSRAAEIGSLRRKR